MQENVFRGTWTYRSLLNEPDGSVEFNKLEFGEGTLRIDAAGPTGLTGTIGGPGWSLSLYGCAGDGSPAEIGFQGKGQVNGEPWIYDYVGWLVPVWPNSTSKQQRTAIVGSVVRAIPHSDGSGGVAPAGVVASFYAVLAS